MKKTILIILISALGCGISQAQFWDQQFQSDLYMVDSHIKRQNMGIDFEDTESYSGTPYNAPFFMNGNVYKDKELLATNVALRYNAIADEIEIKKDMLTPDSEAKVLTQSPDIYVKIGTDIFIFVPYEGDDEKSGYFQVLYEGEKYDLYKKLVKDYQPAQKATSSITRDVPPSFKDEPLYYMISANGKFYEFPSSRGKKIKMFGDKKNDIKDFVKEKNLDVNNEKDLAKVVEYYNKL